MNRKHLVAISLKMFGAFLRLLCCFTPDCVPRVCEACMLKKYVRGSHGFIVCERCGCDICISCYAGPHCCIGCVVPRGIDRPWIPLCGYNPFHGKIAFPWLIDPRFTSEFLRIPLRRLKPKRIGCALDIPVFGPCIWWFSRILRIIASLPFVQQFRPRHRCPTCGKPNPLSTTTCCTYIAQAQITCGAVCCERCWPDHERWHQQLLAIPS